MCLRIKCHQIPQKKCRITIVPSMTGSAPGLPSSKHTGLFSPFPVPCVRLSSGHWLLRGKVKGEGIALNFPYGFRFHIKESSSWLHHIYIWVFLAVRDQGQGAPAIINQPRGGYADVHGMLLGKALFFVLFFLNGSSNYVWDSP